MDIRRRSSQPAAFQTEIKSSKKKNLNSVSDAWFLSLTSQPQTSLSEIVQRCKEVWWENRADDAFFVDGLNYLECRVLSDKVPAPWVIFLSTGSAGWANIHASISLLVSNQLTYVRINDPLEKRIERLKLRGIKCMEREVGNKSLVKKTLWMKRKILTATSSKGLWLNWLYAVEP